MPPWDTSSSKRSWLLTWVVLLYSCFGYPRCTSCPIGFLLSLSDPKTCAHTFWHDLIIIIFLSFQEASVDTGVGTYSKIPHLVKRDLEDDTAGAFMLTLVYRAALTPASCWQRHCGPSDRNGLFRYMTEALFYSTIRNVRRACVGVSLSLYASIWVILSVCACVLFFLMCRVFP